MQNFIDFRLKLSKVFIFFTQTGRLLTVHDDLFNWKCKIGNTVEKVKIEIEILQQLSIKQSLGRSFQAIKFQVLKIFAQLQIANNPWNDLNRD